MMYRPFAHRHSSAAATTHTLSTAFPAVTVQAAARGYHPLAALFPLIQGKDFDELCEDIAANGLIEPIVMLDNMVLDGRNRDRACKAVGVEPTFVSYGGDDPLGYVLSANLHRRHLDTGQRAMIAVELATMRQGERTDLQPSATLQKVSRKAAAAALKVSERSVASAAVVREHGAAELSAAVEAGDIRVKIAADLATEPVERQREIIAALPRDSDGKLTSAARRSLAPVIKELRTEKVMEAKARRAAHEVSLGASQLALPDKRYGVILADPEWDFQVRSEAGKTRHASNHYATSSLDVIKARNVPSISADDCVLFLWATVPMLPHALEVMAAWGFTYKTHFAWIKNRAGTGFWNRNQHELLLLGTRGNVPCPAAGTQRPSVIEAATRRHSQKPDEAYELIEQYFPTLPKVELNARKGRKSWDRWGAEAPPDEAQP